MGNGSAFAHSHRVSQASGMVSVQADCTIDEAVVLMQDRAATMGQTLDEIAAAVVDRSIRFGP
jgi:AmiR/NasT family two-component response regulator